jgi:hypothetical protein
LAGGLSAFLFWPHPLQRIVKPQRQVRQRGAGQRDPGNWREPARSRQRETGFRDPAAKGQFVGIALDLRNPYGVSAERFKRDFCRAMLTNALRKRKLQESTDANKQQLFPSGMAAA